MLKLRWKILILLLIVAMVPLLFVRLADGIAIRRLGREAASYSQAQLISAAEAQLQQVLDSYARELGREETLLTLLLDQQAQAAEKRLHAPQFDDQEPIYFPAQFDDPQSPDAAPGLEISARHIRRDEQGAAQPMLVSFEAQVTLLSQGVPMQSVQEQAARLAGLHKDYSRIRASFPEAMLWQFTSLASGLHVSYPGKGSYPADYDPRQRRWYQHTMSANEICWTTPEPDVTTLSPTLTLARPIRDPSGQAIGVTAIDVPIAAVLGRARLTTAWAADSERFMISFESVNDLKSQRVRLDPKDLPAASADEPWPFIFARSGGGKDEADWRIRPLTRPLRCDDPQQLAEIRRDMAASRSAIRIIRVEDQQMVWAYGPIQHCGPTFLMIAVPLERITAGAAGIVKQIDEAMWANLQSSGLILLITLVLVVLVVWRGSRAISRPLTKLAEAARDVAGGNLDARVVFRQQFRDEFNDMAEAFNSMVPKLRDRMRMRDSLALAMEVQQSLLPGTPPSLVGLDLAGHSVYCDETGGDYYDFLEFETLGSTRLGVVIGDVVGHGVAAALLMATARALLRSRAALPGSIREVFSDVNTHLCNAKFTGRFMTLFYLLIDTSDRKLRWLSAGHDPALLYHPGSGAFEELAGEDIPLGLEADWQYHEFERTGWIGGEVIVLGTDGIWEARNAADEMFGKARLHQIIEQFADQPAAVIARQIDAAVRAFRGNRDQLDDITHVVVKFLPVQN